MFKKMPIFMKIIAAGSILSSLISLLCIGLLFYLPHSQDVISLSGKIDTLALLAQRVICAAVFISIVAYILKNKEPKET